MRGVGVLVRHVEPDITRADTGVSTVGLCVKYPTHSQQTRNCIGYLARAAPRLIPDTGHSTGGCHNCHGETRTLLWYHNRTILKRSTYLLALQLPRENETEVSECVNFVNVPDFKRSSCDWEYWFHHCNHVIGNSPKTWTG